MEELLDFVYNKSKAPIIKVIGVGGGGGNAVTHMFAQGINDVSFALCNTDYQALNRSPILHKVQLGEKGLGAGNRPHKAKEAAECSIESIKEMLTDGTEMVFITAGMGGGTGTGAAPVVAKVSKELGILTVGIVTIPFLFEGEKKILQALDGVEEIGKYVDALLVINNERLRDIYRDLDFLNAFGKADDTLSTAAKSIAELITVTGYVNLDFADVNTTLKDGGVAVMSSGYGEGEGRIGKSIEDALHSPLLNNNDIFSARRVLINLYFSENSQIKMEEMNDIHEFMSRFSSEVEVIWGAAFDNELGERVKITILAAGFELSTLPAFRETRKKRQLFPAATTATEGDKEESVASTLGEQPSTKERIQDFYGKTPPNLARPIRKSIPAVLTIDQMDNDKLIDLLEQTPTYNRDPKILAPLLGTPPQGAASESETTPGGGNPAQRTIRF